MIVIEQTLYSTCWWNEFKLKIKLIRSRNIKLKYAELKTRFFDKIVDFFDDDFVSLYSSAEAVHSVVVLSNRNNQSKLSVQTLSQIVNNQRFISDAYVPKQIDFTWKILIECRIFIESKKHLLNFFYWVKSIWSILSK